MTDTLEDWLRYQSVSFENQLKFVRSPEIAAWINACRLDANGALLASARPEDGERWPLADKLRRQFVPALQNLKRLAAE